jgi:TonB family protein
MYNAVGLIVSFFVNAIWQVTVIAGTGWLALRLLGRLGPRAQHSAAVGTLAAATIVPILPALQELLITSLFGRPMSTSRFIIADAATQNFGTVGRIAHIVPIALLWPLLSLYLGITIYSAIRLACSLNIALGLSREARAITLTPEQSELWDRCKRSFALPVVRVESSRRIRGPVALGFRKPILLFPEGFIERCEPQDLLAALAHECAHVQRNDFAKNLVYEAASLIVAFHPAVWFIKSQIAQTREMICDATVAETFAEPRSYAHSLVRLAELVAAVPRIPASPAVGIFDANILEKRIMTINAKQRPSSVLLRASYVLSATLLFFGITAASTAMAVVVEPQSPAQKSVQASAYGQIYKIGEDVTAPEVIKSIDAKFPKSAHGTKGSSAIVLVHLIVDAGGMPRDVHIQRSYNADFDAEAVKAVKQYQFKPAMHQGKPVAVAINVEVNFEKF